MVSVIPPSAETAWLLRLTGSGAHRPASRGESRAAAEAVLGPGPVAWAVDIGYEIASKIVSEVPGFALPHSSPDVLRMGTESSVIEALLLLYTGDDVAVGPAEALMGDREFVRRGIPLEAVLRGIRLAHAVLFRSILQEATRFLEEPSRAAEMERTSSVLFEYIDAFSTAMTTEYAQESARWSTSRSALLAEQVKSILSPHEAVDIEATSRALGYPLARHHVAAVLWRDSASPAAEELTRTAERLPRADIGSSLVVPDGTSTAWIWVGTRSAVNAAAVLNPPSDPGLHLVVGTPGKGLDGFRRSLHEATRAASVIQGATPIRRRSLPDVHYYADVELSALAGQDLALAQGLVARELGELAQDSAAAHELRQTTAAYLATHRSLASAADQLQVARNTVAYRIKKVESLLGRDLHDRRLELEVALRLADQLGPAVLIRPDA